MSERGGERDRRAWRARRREPARPGPARPRPIPIPIPLSLSGRERERGRHTEQAGHSASDITQPGQASLGRTRTDSASQPPKLLCMHLSLSASPYPVHLAERQQERGGGAGQSKFSSARRARERNTLPRPCPARPGLDRLPGGPTLPPAALHKTIQTPNNGVSRRMQARTRERLHSGRQHGLGLTTSCKYVWSNIFCLATQT